MARGYRETIALELVEIQLWVDADCLWQTVQPDWISEEQFNGSCYSSV